MINIFYIFFGLSLGNYVLYFLGKNTLKEANNRTYTGFVFFISIYVILFSGLLTPPFKLVQ